MAQIWQLVHSLTLYQRPEMIVTKRALANHGAEGFAEIVYEDIGWAKPNKPTRDWGLGISGV